MALMVVSFNLHENVSVLTFFVSAWNTIIEPTFILGSCTTYNQFKAELPFLLLGLSSFHLMPLVRLPTSDGRQYLR